MARDMNRPQVWAQQHPQLAADLREIGALDQALEVNQGDLMEMGCGTVGWLAIAAVVAEGVEQWGWSPWWLGGVALALLLAVVGLVECVVLLCERRQIRRAIAEPPAGGDQ